MKLEDEIKQNKEFISEQHKLSVNISFTANWLYNKTEKFFKEHNLTPQQFNILRILRGQYPNPSTMKLLRERMIDKMSDTSRLVDNLFKKDFVIRNVCPGDRRQSDVFISEKGLSVLKEIDNLIPDFEKKHLSTLSNEEMHQLNELLDKLRG
jgi:DNA-binding MarR family transcriptional regulator